MTIALRNIPEPRRYQVAVRRSQGQGIAANAAKDYLEKKLKGGKK